MPDPPGLRIVVREGAFIDQLAGLVGLAEGEGIILGLYIAPFREIVIREGLPADCRAMVLRHERGHARCGWQHG